MKHDFENPKIDIIYNENNLLILFIFMIILTPYSFSLTYNILYVQCFLIVETCFNSNFHT